MLRLLTALALMLTLADHWTTWLCLHAPVDGWIVTEANPFADWLFDQAGLSAGLAIDTALTFAAVAFLAGTGVFDRHVKIGLMAVITLSTGYAVVNNFGAITRMGLSPWHGWL